MKRYTGVNFYDLLEVSPSATPEQIRQAYEMAKQTYGSDSMVTYSLFDSQSRNQIMDRIEQAFSTLADERLRRAYDQEIGLKQKPVETVPPGMSGSAVVPSPPVGGTESETPPDRSVTVREEEVRGPFLKEIREKRGIPLQEIADKTRINITYLEYIERENFKSLPAEVYLKGYLEQYAGSLGLQPTALIAGYLRILREWKQKKEQL
jgi:curved DNA-binding protein CbpA